MSYETLLVTPPPSLFMGQRRAADPHLVLHGKGEHAGTVLFIDNAELDRLLLDAELVAKQRADYEPPIDSLLKGASKASPQVLEAFSAALDRRFLRRHHERLMCEAAQRIAGDAIAAFARAFA